MVRKLLLVHSFHEEATFPDKSAYPVLAHLSVGYPGYQGRLLTRYSPVRHSTQIPKKTFAFDLHVLSTPPAFVLSQDQTLQFDILDYLQKIVTYIVLSPAKGDKLLRNKFLRVVNYIRAQL